MNIEEILKEREEWFKWKNIAPIVTQLNNLKLKMKNWKIDSFFLNNTIEINLSNYDKDFLLNTAKMLKPWRKGPFKVGDIFIDSEWKSYIKWNTLIPFLDLENKDILDVGCNNGYYMFRMLEMDPKSITGFDPSALFNLQFEFINSFINSKIKIEYKLLGVEHIPYYHKKFDVIFCMGVLYHRKDPIDMLKTLKAGLKKGGEVILDTLIIEGNEEVALSPLRYAKMKNVYFIPTLKTLYNWIKRANFSDVKFIGKRYTTTNEQRKTDWIEGESLESFLNKTQTKTIEGYDPPLRCYLKLKN
ncbi:tRNA 5-methoxyuridine(34)/uridine 5-oxyacetic acid(34) synthase CmoB [Caminibacter mediatlanticus]|uniref:Generic methyltransferase n=1 Tax=Caminibacter mediatlanticus TB-2 TaxID=391592 RepID=A0AAI9F350_9BACT|nr:tRNA 5-methoxyuridine(34)/uridine 5-oxyacetic acid(34) synthase CmoB [Caminibacter mediatlanticus]EDM24483.1 Generic methyltransferase [Caminibacter mediatlanticus TB-2]